MDFNFYKPPFLLFCFLTAVTLFTAGEARAQMFSVQEDDRPRNQRTPSNNIYLGLEPVQFDYKGPASIAGGPSAGLFAFDGPVIRLKYETIGLSAFLGVGGGLTGIDNVGYFDVGIKAMRGLRLVTERNLTLQIPLQLKSSLTSVNNDQVVNTTSQFRQGTLTVGGGGEIRARLDDNIRVAAGVIPNYGFSFATGGTFGGQLFELETTTRLYFDRAFGGVGISVGWDYTFKRFDIDEDEFDYNFGSHGFLIGITF